jgi:hypothetical protein
VVDPCSKNGFADWWKTTAADRFTKIPVLALDHRRFWDAMHAIPTGALARIEHAVALKVCEAFGLDTRSVALDMTNFATCISTGNDKAPIAQRGKAKRPALDVGGAGVVPDPAERVVARPALGVVAVGSPPRALQHATGRCPNRCLTWAITPARAGVTQPPVPDGSGTLHPPPPETPSVSAPKEWLATYHSPEPVEIEFLDSSGHRWTRDEQGTLG